MAIITPDTFDPLRRFVSVRLQQGVPVVDADWNERDDIRRFELRAYLKWFVGDGVPEGSDGFRILALPAPAANDFVVSAGVPPAPGGETALNTGLRHFGRCLVDGLEAAIETDTDYRAQPLHDATPTAPAEAALRGTVTIPELPLLDGTVTVYLDVWERLVRPEEDPSLIFVDIGTESCARLRQEWTVRARIGTAIPVSGDADFEAGHSYYGLAQIARVAADPVVFPSQITDIRERRLLTPPATLAEDMLATTPDRYRRGLDRPAVPLRTALNALLRGQLPASDDQIIAPDPSNDNATRAAAINGNQTHLLWHSNRAGGVNQIFATSWSDADPTAAGTNPPVQVTPGPASAETPTLVMLPTTPEPALLVAYQTENNIRFRRAAAPAGLPAAAETAVAEQAEVEAHPVAVRTSQIVTFFWYWNGPGATDRIRYRRRQYDASWDEAAAVWLDGETSDLSTLRARSPSTAPGILHAATDSADRIWVSFRTQANTIAVARLTPTTGAIETFTDLELDSGTSDQQPFVLVDEPGAVWVFWRGDLAIHQARYDIATDTWGAATAIPGTDGPNDANERPTAVVDADGGIWLLWGRDDAGTTNIWTVGRDPNTGGWGSPRQVTASSGANDFPLAFLRDGTIRLIFRSNRGGQFDLFQKNLIITI